MIGKIKNIKDYFFEPKIESDQQLFSTPILLFGKNWRIMNDYWMKHVHIKITDLCDAKCPFCIERNSHIKNNNLHLFSNIKQLTQQLYEQGHLTTVSITGGEPSLNELTGEVIDYLKSIPNVFLNINTNFHRIIESSRDPDWVNISRHIIGPDTYCHIQDLDTRLVSLYREKHPSTKIRLQCVLHPYGLKSIEQIKEYIKFYKDFADDISFRRLIDVSNEKSENDLYQQLKHYLYDNASFVEQLVKDYYVYETWNIEGFNISLYQSNMAFLHNIEQIEDDKILREIVVHPDGLISGSWYRNKKIITM